MTKLKKELPLLLVIFVQLILLLYLFPDLSQEVPVHWNIKGEADRYGPAYIPLLIIIGVYLLTLILPSVDPRKKNYSAFSGPYYKIRAGIVLLFTLINIMTFLFASGVSLNPGILIPALIFLIFALLGNYMGALKSNWFVGFRLPWTLESEEVWRRTHRLAGRIWFWAGIIGLILLLLIPSAYFPWLLISVIILIVVIPVVYSYTIYHRLYEK